MEPSAQSLTAYDLAGIDVNLRLIERYKFTVCNCIREMLLDTSELLLHNHEFVAVEDDPVLTAALSHTVGIDDLVHYVSGIGDDEVF